MNIRKRIRSFLLKYYIIPKIITRPKNLLTVKTACVDTRMVSGPYLLKQIKK